MNDNKRGFGSMDEQKQREASGKGGKANDLMPIDPACVNACPLRSCRKTS